MNEIEKAKRRSYRKVCKTEAAESEQNVEENY